MTAELVTEMARTRDNIRNLMTIVRHWQDGSAKPSRASFKLLEDVLLLIAGQVDDIAPALAREERRLEAMLADTERTLQLALDAAEAVATRNGVLGALADAQAAGEAVDLIDEMSGTRIIYDPSRDKRPFRPADLGQPVYLPDEPDGFLEDMAVPTDSAATGNVVALARYRQSRAATRPQTDGAA